MNGHPRAGSRQSALTIREATGADLAAVRALCMQTLEPVDLDDTEGLERLLWRDPDSDPRMNLVAEARRELVGCVFGSARDYGKGDGLIGFIKLATVRPDARRQHTGTQLLTRLEDILFDVGATCIWAGGSEPRYWWPGVDKVNTTASAFFSHAGYVPVTDVANLRVSLTRPRPQEASPPDGVVSRRLSRREWPQFKIWMEEEWGAAWRDEVELTLDRSPISCFVSSEDGAYIGFAAYDTNRTGWFGPMGSSPHARGKGIGRLLLNKCLDDYRARGLSDCVIAWAGPQDFYRGAVGAEIGREFVRFRKMTNKVVA